MQYIVPIVALFQGRVIDKPKQPMEKTEYLTKGEVEHEVSTSFNVAGSDMDVLVDLHNFRSPILCY